MMAEIESGLMCHLLGGLGGGLGETGAATIAGFLKVGPLVIRVYATTA